MTLTQFLWVAIPAISFILYTILFLQRRRDLGKVERWFTMFLAAAMVWSLGSLLLHLAPGSIDPVWWNRLLMMGNVAAPLTLFGFTVHFLSLRRQQGWLPLLIALYVAAAIANLAGFVVVEATVIQGEVYNTYGWGLGIVSILWSACIYPALYFVIRELRHSQDRMFRNRLKYVLAVQLLIFVGSLLNLTALSAYPIDLLVACIVALLVFVSISRYQLLEIGYSVRRLAVLLFMILAYIAVVSTGVFLLGHAEEEQLVWTGLITAVVTALLLLSYRPIRNSLTSFVDRVFLPARYDAQILIYGISRLSNRLYLPAALGDAVLREVAAALHIHAAALVLRSTSSDQYETVASLGMDAAGSQVRFQADSPLITALRHETMAIPMARLMELPRMRALWIEEWEALQQMETEILLPILYEDALLGFFSLGARRDGEPYRAIELRQVLPTLANQISTAIENSRLYAQEQARADALAKANEELRQLDRMKDELIQNVSHELRTPLSIIHGYAEAMTDEQMVGMGLTPAHAGQTILKQTQRLSRLVNDILLLSQIETDRTPFEPIDLYALVESCCQDMAVAQDRRIHIELAPPEYANLHVMGIGFRLRQVVDNLLTNAIKFSPARATVLVRVYAANGDLVTSVTDQGIGITPEELGRIWDRFYRANTALTSATRGAGLGLAIVRKLVEWHQGWVDVESEVSKGSTFRFGLPAVEIEPKADAEQTAEPAREHVEVTHSHGTPSRP